MEKEPKYCTECGALLVKVNKEFERFEGKRFDPYTGEKTQGYICPVMKVYLKTHYWGFLSGVAQYMWRPKDAAVTMNYPHGHTRINC